MLGQPSLAFATFTATIDRALPWIYLLYAIPSVFVLTWLTPPFQAPDEEAHFLRAETISRGALLLHREIYEDRLVAGAAIDKNVWKVSRHFAFLWGAPGNRVAKNDWLQVQSIGWDGDVAFQPLPAVAVYPPFFYFPQVVAITAAKFFNASILNSLYLARLLNGMAAIGLAYLALRMAPCGRTFLFTILLLPMTSFLMASASQDAILISGCVLMASLTMRLLAVDRTSPSEVAASALLLLLLVMARPPLFVLAIPWVFLVIKCKGNFASKEVITAGVTFAVALMGWIYYLTTVRSEFRPGLTHPETQITGFGEPIVLLSKMARTLVVHGENYLYGAIGNLGWLDTPLPAWYYLATGVIVAVIGLSNGIKGIPFLIRLGVSGSMMVYALSLFAIQYVLWTSPADALVEGVQGRYFLPVLPLVPMLLPGLPRLKTAVLPLAISLPALSFAVTVIAIVQRYYLVH